MLSGCLDALLITATRSFLFLPPQSLWEVWVERNIDVWGWWWFFSPFPIAARVLSERIDEVVEPLPVWVIHCVWVGVGIFSSWLIKGLLCTFLYERGYSWLGLFCPWAHFLRSNMFLFQSVKCICCSFFSPIFHSSCLGDWLLHIFHSADWVPFMSASVFAKVHVLPIHCSLLHKPGYLTACVCPSHHYSPCWLLKYSHV